MSPYPNLIIMLDLNFKSHSLKFKIPKSSIKNYTPPISLAAFGIALIQRFQGNF